MYKRQDLVKTKAAMQKCDELLIFHIKEPKKNKHKGKALCKITIFAAVCFYFFDGGKRKFKMHFKHWHFGILPIAF